MAACVVVPVLANGARAWGTIYVAQSRGVAFAAGFDHIVYGWIFFALVMAVVLGVASRFYDRPANDRLLDAEALERSSMLRRLALYRIGAGIALTAMLLAALATLSGVAMGRPLIEGLLAAAALHP